MMAAEKIKTLVIGGNEIVMDAPIKQKLEIDDLTIVRIYPSDDNLNSYSQEKLNRNIYAFNLSGQLVWQIQEAPHGGKDNDKAYMDMRIDKGCLVAGNWIGIDYQVAMKDGAVTPLNQGVRPW